jgi:curli production assembly/transport component CsgG
MKRLIVLMTALLLTGCGGTTAQKSLEVYAQPPEPRIQEAPLARELESLPEIDGKKITIAVYGFSDKTGQRKPADNIANLSSAVTQGAEVWVIKALSDAGKGSWFDVVERIGLDNLVKERQLIRNTREVYEKELPNGPTPLKPMKFAGLILEGGIIGYDSNVAVGGLGARYLGVGAQTEYRVDTVTVVMRIVSVSTGGVLLSVATEKTIASSRSGVDMFKFFDLGTKLVEAENGYSVNEPVNYAVRAAIEAGVVELIKEGERKGLWKFKSETKREDVVLAKPVVKVIVKKPEVVEKPEVAAVEKKAEPKVVEKPVVKPEPKVKPKIKVVPVEKTKPEVTVTKRSVDKDVIPLDMAMPKPKPTLIERMCNPEIMKITDVCASDTEDLRKRLKVGIEKHVHIDEVLKDANKYEGYGVCDKNNLCFRNVAEMYRWESWTNWLAHVNEGKNFNLVK